MMTIKCSTGFHIWNGCICNECNKIRDEQHDWSKDCLICSRCGKVVEESNNKIFEIPVGYSYAHDRLTSHLNTSSGSSKTISVLDDVIKVINEYSSFKSDKERSISVWNYVEMTQYLFDIINQDLDTIIEKDKETEMMRIILAGLKKVVILTHCRVTNNEIPDDVESILNLCGPLEVDEIIKYLSSEGFNVSIRTQENKHDWSKDCEKCSKCSRTRTEKHEWNYCICSKCGKIRDEQHDWSKDCEKCSKCSKTIDGQHAWIGCHCSKCSKNRDKEHELLNGICKICGQGTFMDIRDGNIYKVVKIGNQIIMADNFAYKPNNGIYWTYNNDPNNVDQYGYLYDWETAKTVAPQGWHLPTKEEWNILYKNLGDHKWVVYKEIMPSGSSGFNALFGGFHYSDGIVGYIQPGAYFWSSSPEGESDAWYFSCPANNGYASLSNFYRSCGFSVRLFRD